MALAATHLTSGASTSSASTYTSASVAPPAQRLLVIAAAGTRSDARVPTVSGLGLTWTQVNGGATPVGTVNYSLYMFIAWTGNTAPPAGGVSVNWTANMTGCQWSLSSWEGVDNAAGPIVQSVFAQDVAGLLAPSLTLAAFASPSNGTWGSIHTNKDTETVTAGAGFTLFGQAQNGGPPAKIASEGRADADTTVDFGGVATTTPWGIVAAEIRAAVTGPVVVTASDTLMVGITDTPYAAPGNANFWPPPGIGGSYRASTFDILRDDLVKTYGWTEHQLSPAEDTLLEGITCKQGHIMAGRTCLESPEGLHYLFGWCDTPHSEAVAHFPPFELGAGSVG